MESDKRSEKQLTFFFLLLLSALATELMIVLVFLLALEV